MKMKKSLYISKPKLCFCVSFVPNEKADGLIWNRSPLFFNPTSTIKTLTHMHQQPWISVRVPSALHFIYVSCLLNHGHSLPIWIRDRQDMRAFLESRLDYCGSLFVFQPNKLHITHPDKTPASQYISNTLFVYSLRMILFFEVWSPGYCLGLSVKF